MAKGLLLIVCLLSSVVFAHGQDIITRTDGKTIQAKVLDVQPTLIRFRLFGSADSLVFQISPTDVQTIKMEDGTIRTFSTPISQTTVKTGKEKENSNLETNFRRNTLSFYPLDLLYSNLTLAYECISASGKIGVKVPVTYGMGGNSGNSYNSFRENVLFGTGLEVNFYPEGQGELRYYITPAVNYRVFASTYYIPPGFEEQNENASMMTFALKGGAYYLIAKTFLVSVDVGMGYRAFYSDLPPSEEQYHNLNSKFYLPANFHFGIRF